MVWSGGPRARHAAAAHRGQAVQPPTLRCVTGPPHTVSCDSRQALCHKRSGQNGCRASSVALRPRRLLPSRAWRCVNGLNICPLCTVTLCCRHWDAAHKDCANVALIRRARRRAGTHAALGGGAGAGLPADGPRRELGIERRTRAAGGLPAVHR